MLRTALAERYTQRGIPTEPEQIMITTGGQQALALVSRLLLDPGDMVVAQAPTYPGALKLFRDAAAMIRPIRTIVDEPDINAWQAALADRPRLAYLNPTNHNPTGGTLPVLARRKLVKIAVEHGCR